MKSIFVWLCLAATATSADLKTLVEKAENPPKPPETVKFIETKSKEACTGTMCKLPVGSGDSTIRLVLPTDAIQVGKQSTITLDGIPSPSLPNLRMSVAPAGGITYNIGKGLATDSPAFIDITPIKSGDYTFTLAAPDGQSGMLFATQIVTAAPGPTPAPDIPIVPIPGPGPNPPTPGKEKIRVLVIYDPSKSADQNQATLLLAEGAGSFHGYVYSHCPQETVTTKEGETKTTYGYRQVSLGVDLNTLSPAWKDIVAKAGTTTGMTVQVGNSPPVRYDLPVTTEEALKILTPLGGN